MPATHVAGFGDLLAGHDPEFEKTWSKEQRGRLMEKIVWSPTQNANCSLKLEGGTSKCLTIVASATQSNYNSP